MKIRKADISGLIMDKFYGTDSNLIQFVAEVHTFLYESNMLFTTNDNGVQMCDKVYLSTLWSYDELVDVISVLVKLIDNGYGVMDNKFKLITIFNKLRGNIKYELVKNVLDNLDFPNEYFEMESAVNEYVEHQKDNEIDELLSELSSTEGVEVIVVNMGSISE